VLTSGIENPILNTMPNTETCETLRVLSSTDVCDSPAHAMLDAGALHGDAQCAGIGAALIFVRALCAPGHLAKLVKREQQLAADRRKRAA
jgi:hypothetical protein